MWFRRKMPKEEKPALSAAVSSDLPAKEMPPSAFEERLAERIFDIGFSRLNDDGTRAIYKPIRKTLYFQNDDFIRATCLELAITAVEKGVESETYRNVLERLGKIEPIYSECAGDILEMITTSLRKESYTTQEANRRIARPRHPCALPPR